MQLLSKRALLASFISVIICTSCNKNKDLVTPVTSKPATNPVSVTDPNVAKDSALLEARDLYLWYNQIPSTFNARSYDDPDKIMTAIRQYSIEPGFSGPIDRWSFGMKKVDWDNLSSGISASFSSTTNSAGNYGLGVFFLAQGDLRVKSVERASPAGVAGIHRGWRITKINGSTDITTGNSTFIIDNVFNSTSTNFTFLKPDGTTVDITLNAAHYADHPVFFDNVYTISSKKIGYMVFNSFLGDTTEISNEFQRVFSNFANQNVNDMVIDLRYNGGGYVSVQEKLADYLVAASANGGLMMKEQYNDKHSAYNVSTNFRKLGSLNLSRVFFIVSSSTASASELLINNLKPYMDVKLLGPSSTHGKPVGFFPVPAGDWYVFPVSFKSTNKNGVGNYYNGLPVDAQVADGLDKDWGDVTETGFASAIKYITSGSFRTQATVPFTPLPAEVISGNDKLDQPSFKGSVDSRKGLK
ncbi:MAG: hypothetical protein H0W12_07085 [Chitinophagaceae bacterium]|nr:hypothetical protein [Chitinophagaceae bacterium]